MYPRVEVMQFSLDFFQKVYQSLLPISYIYVLKTWFTNDCNQLDLVVTLFITINLCSMKYLFLSLFLLISGIIIAQPTPEIVRQMISEGIKSLNITPENIFKIENKVVNEVPVRIYYPSSEQQLPIIYNVHGGALVAGDLETHENISRRLANATNSIVVALDYRKAPENPYPKSLEDVVAIYSWIINNQISIGGKKAPISIVSDSGGCLLVAALQIQIKNQKLSQAIDKVVYINPAFDLRETNDDFYKLVIEWYLSRADPNNELVSPITANDFSVFSPCLIVVNEKDILLPQGVDFSKKLNLLKIKNELVTIKDEDHFGVYWPAAHPVINQAFDYSVKFLSGK
jgi:acetyl esterase